MEGRRIATEVNGQITYYAYNGDNTRADSDGAGSVLARYLFGDENDEILARWHPGAGTAWYLADRLGTVRDFVDVTGALVTHVDYDSFGQVLAQAADFQVQWLQMLDSATDPYLRESLVRGIAKGFEGTEDLHCSQRLAAIAADPKESADVRLAAYY